MIATTLTIKAAIEQRFSLRGLPLFESMKNLGLEPKDMQPLRIKLKDTFGPLVEVTLSDTIDSIYDKINAKQNEENRHKGVFTPPEETGAV